MRQKNIFFILLTSTIVLLSACSSDDDKVTKEFNATCKYSIDILGFTNQITTTEPITEGLDELLRNYNYNPPVINGSMKVTSSSFKISGLEEGVILKNFILIINDYEKNFGDITIINSDLYIDANLNYFQESFKRMVSQGKLKVQMTFTPNKKLDENNNVKLNLSFDGIYYYHL